MERDVHARIGCALLLALLPWRTRAAALTPYLPLDLPAPMAARIERVLLLADRAVLRRPIAVAQVREALSRACPRDPVLCSQVERDLARYADERPVTDVRLEVAVTGGQAVPLANRRGLDSDDAWSAAALAQWRAGEHLLLGVGGTARPGHVDPAGSLLSLGTPNARLDVGYREHWSSALAGSSFLASTEAATMPSITLSNTTPLGRYGIDYGVALSWMSRSERIAYRDGYTSGHPLLAETQFGIEPVPGWSLGITRQLQFGGGARNAHGPWDFVKAFVDPNGYDNTRVGASWDNEYGNQQAAWTSRFIIPAAKPVAVSMEYAGEDTSHSTDGRLGNAGVSLGIHVPDLWAGIGLGYEISEWQNGWYEHHIYQDGVVNDGRVIGHWGADQRAAGDSVGARSHVLWLDRATPSGGSIGMQLRMLANRGYSAPDYHRATELQLRYSRPVRNALVGAELLVGRDTFGERYLRLAASLRLLDHGHASAGGADAADLAGGNGDAVDHAVFAVTGFAVSRVRIQLDSGDLPGATTVLRGAPHLALGARRAVTARSDLGVRLEYDRVDERALLAVRALDYHYRVGNHLAVGGFAGVARYDLATPAFGYYLGAGIQLREVLPRWDVNFEVRYGDKISRDHLLPQEAGLRQPDSFYDFSGALLGLSYRF